MSANPASGQYHFDATRYRDPNQNRQHNIITNDGVGAPSAEPPPAAPSIPSGPSQDTWALHQNILKDYNDRAAKETDPTRKAEILAQSAEVHNAYLQGRPYPDFVQRAQQQQQQQAAVNVAGLQAQTAGVKAGAPVAAAQARANGQVQAAQINSATKEKLGFGGFDSKQKTAQIGADAKTRAAQIIAASKAGGVMPSPEDLKWAKGIIEGGAPTAAPSTTPQLAPSPAPAAAPGAPAIPTGPAAGPTAAPGAPAITPSAASSGAPGASPTQPPIPALPGVSGLNNPFYVTPQAPAAPLDGKSRAPGSTAPGSVIAADGKTYTGADGKRYVVEGLPTNIKFDAGDYGTSPATAKSQQQPAGVSDASLAAWRNYRAKTGDTSMSLRDYTENFAPAENAANNTPAVQASAAAATSARQRADAAQARSDQSTADANNLNRQIANQQPYSGSPYRADGSQASTVTGKAPPPGSPTASLAAPATAATAPQPGANPSATPNVAVLTPPITAPTSPPFAASIGAPGASPGQAALAPLGVPNASPRVPTAQPAAPSAAAKRTLTFNGVQFTDNGDGTVTSPQGAVYAHTNGRITARIR